MGKPKIEEVVVPYTQIRRLPTTFADMVKEHRDCTDMIKVLKDRQKKLKDILIPAMMASKQRHIGVPWEDDEGQVIHGVSHLCSGTTARKIDGKILMAKYNVPSDHIVGATVGGKKYDYVTVTIAGEAPESRRAGAPNRVRSTRARRSLQRASVPAKRFTAARAIAYVVHAPR